MIAPEYLTPPMRCSHRLRVRWAEVDMQKIVFNAHYLQYFDTAMADYWRDLCLPYEAAMHLLQIFLGLSACDTSCRTPGASSTSVETQEMPCPVFGPARSRTPYPRSNPMT